jgi:hypothetical protein
MPGGACERDNWQVEEYSFYGTPGDVKGKLSKGGFPIDRRYFFAVVTTADSGRVHEFEQKTGNLYSVRTAEIGSKSATSFNSDIVQAVHDNQGKACVGDKVHQLSSYKTIRFSPPTEEKVDSNTLVALATAPRKEDFLGASFHFLC